MHKGFLPKLVGGPLIGSGSTQNQSINAASNESAEWESNVSHKRMEAAVYITAHLNNQKLIMRDDKGGEESESAFLQMIVRLLSTGNWKSSA